MESLERDPTFEEPLIRLARWLDRWRPYWAERPFVSRRLSWEPECPELSRALRDLPEDVIEAHESRPWALEGLPEPFPRLAAEAARWSRRPRFRLPPSEPDIRARPKKIRARKWAQLERFSRLVISESGGGVDHWVDWCSGKGHLGRTLARETSLPFTAIEREEGLCRAGATLAVAEGVEGRFIVADVLREELAELFAGGSGAVALHACGGLHEGLLRRATDGGASFLAVAPCCYHRFRSDEQGPLSTLAQQTGLHLDRGQLKLVGLQEVVVSSRRARLRRREQRFRLGLDRLVREATGEDVYHSLGPSPRGWADLSFVSYCYRMAERAGVAIRPPRDWAELERWAGERLRIARGLALVRGLFRGPIETWLLLDRARFLVEAGWTVAVGTFCSSTITPRNSAIVARRE